MPEPHDIALAPDRNLWGGCIVRVTALDPTTGNTVANVKVSNIVLSVTNVGGTNLDAIGPFMLVPGPGA